MNLFYPNSAPSHSLSFASLVPFPYPFVPFEKTHKNHGPKLLFRWNSHPIGAKLNQSCNGKSTSGGGNIDGSDTSSDLCVGPDEPVEVIVVGSRKDALLDYCSASPFLSPSLRFWNITGYDSEHVRLQQRCTKQESTPRTVEDFLALQSSCKAVILVASAAYGSDHITALNVLSNVNSANGFVVAIMLKPFSFEGQRRQDEIKDLVNKLQNKANCCIAVLDTNTLLENDLVTLDEALRTSNHAVLMAMNAISFLISEKHIKLLNAKHNSTREVKLPEFREILETHSGARIAFGTGQNVESSLLRAINECPFLGVGIEELDGVLLCVFANSGDMDYSDVTTIFNTVRSITRCNREIIICVVREPHLEPNTILTTVIAFGCARQQLAPKNGIFSSLGQHFPFIFSMFKRPYQQTMNSGEPYISNNQHISDVANSPAPMRGANLFDGTPEDAHVFSGKIEPLSENTDERSNYSAEREVESLEGNPNSSPYELNSEGSPMFTRELLARGNLGPGYPSELSKYGPNSSEATVLIDTISVYKLPVGIKHSEKSEDTPLRSKSKQRAEGRVIADENKQHRASPGVPWNGLTKAVDLKNRASTSNKRNYTNNSEKQGGLSVRAASMLESERDSEKKWSRVAKMNYRGGIYRGHAQGGLPEGKGRLLLGDGSIYDGMWRYGKRSGLGTFYFHNGDVFQGSWRDDLMHGKGWYYFHTGDRWFVNFWKGKANGESRFYSKLGDVFFGHFKEGWRHGYFLRINVDGTRCQELWDEGVLISEKQLDPNAELG